MTRVILALHAHAGLEGLDDAVLGDGLRAALRALGASRLQVNLDDGPVADALRIATGDPLRALLTVDLPGEAAPVVDVVRPFDPDVVAWEVESREPLEPPEVADGVRADALANVALLRRPPELDVEEWRHRWLVEHTPVAIATQATFGYVQNVVVRALTPEPGEPVAAVVEELFPAAAVHDMHAFYGSGGDDAELSDRLTRLMASVSRMGADRGLDLVPTGRYVFAL